MRSKHRGSSAGGQHRVRQLLIAARKRLVEPAIPLRLKALSYVRTCCSAMRTAERLTRRARRLLGSRTRYVSLLAALARRDPTWWRQCSVTGHGFLVSADPTIAALLLPLYLFAAQRLTGRAA